MDKLHASAGPITAATLLILPVLYLASYLALVKPVGTMQLWSGYVDHYRVGGRYAAAFYYPLEQIDRKLRPGAWQDNVPLVH
jgi:hypothetical protein